MELKRKIILFVVFRGCLLVAPVPIRTSLSVPTRNHYSIYNWIANISVSDPDPESPSEHCHVLVNEINTDNLSSVTTKEFLELFKLCNTPRKGRKRSKALLGYKVVIIAGTQDKTEIVFVADLKDEMMVDSEESRHFVIGTPGVSNVNMDTSNVNIRNVFEKPQHVNILPNGDTNPYAVLLLYNISPKVLKVITLNKPTQGGHYAPTPVTALMTRLIQENVKGMLIYDRKAPTNRCAFFESVWPKPLIDEQNMFRDWDNHEGGNDYSINRCGVTNEPFVLTRKLGIPTPGELNDCTRASFILEDHIDEVANLVFPQHGEDVQPNVCSPIGIDQGRYAVVSENQLHSLVEDTLSKAAAWLPQNTDTAKTGVPENLETGDLGIDIIRENDMLKNMNYPGLE